MAGNSSFGRSAGVSVGRGAILIAVALALGIFLLQKTDRRTTARVSSVPTTAPATNLTLPTTTPTSSATRSPSTVRVLVINATNISGAATRVGQPLTAAGYNVLAPTDATTAAKASIKTTTVFYTAGYQPEANVIAQLLSLPSTAAQPLPAPAPVANTQSANVVVAVASDLASKATTATTAHTGTTAHTATTLHTTTTAHSATTASTAHTSTTH